MERIQITVISQIVIDKKPQRTGGFEITVERIGIDQYGQQWHSIHTRNIRADEAFEIGDTFPLEERQ